MIRHLPPAARPSGAAPDQPAESEPPAPLTFPGYDPSGLIGQIRAGRPHPAGHPRDLVLGWLLSLPAGIDPAYAARSLLQGWPARVAPDISALLAEIAQYPRERLDGLLAYRRQLRKAAGGRSGRWVQLCPSVRLRGI